MRSLLALLFVSSSFAAEILVPDAAAFEKTAAEAKAGDVIVLQDGEWKDAKLKIRTSGTEDTPITIRAQNAGKVILTGDSRLQLGGRFLLVEGLLFQNPTGEEAIELRIDTDEVAHDCRVTQCAVINTLPAVDTEKTARFISIYGREHRVDHCRFEGKTTEGPTMVVWLSLEAKDWGHHRIDHNHFGPRERLGKNGGETIRLGDSKTSMLQAKCVVEHNLFEKCNGEAECISNKSCGNTYERNTFVEVSGTLTLRHGNGCLVEQNAFLGNEAKGSGGVRVIGENHVVRSNYFEKLAGDKERSPLCLMAGIPSSPENGYFQVKNLLIQHNTFVDCKSSFLFGFAGDKQATLMPEGVLGTNNRFTNMKPKELPDNASMRWHQRGLTRPVWVDAREVAGITWKP